MRRACLLLAVLGMTLLARAAGAQPAEITSQDYDSNHEGWNGLSRFASLARGLGLRHEATDSYDWGELGAKHILVIVYPMNRLDASHLAAFVRAGGHVLLADDFGESTEAMGRLGMLRKPAVGVGATRFADDRPWAPIARPFLPDHPLAKGVDEITTNHPAILSRVRSPAAAVFGFGRGEAVVAAGSYGSGRFVVVSDPSIFINRMLQFHGNLQLAINILRFLHRDSTEEIVIVAKESTLTGIPRSAIGDGTLRGKVARGMSDLNSWLDERNDYLLRENWLRALGLIVAVMVGVVGLLTLPLRRKANLDGTWIRARSSTAGLHDFEELVGHYDGKGKRGSYLLPATVLRDNVNAALARLLEVSEPLYSVPEAQLLRSVKERCGSAAAEALERLYRRLRMLPSRAQAASPWTSSFFGRREFERLHYDADRLFATLEQDASGTGETIAGTGATIKVDAE